MKIFGPIGPALGWPYKGLMPSLRDNLRIQKPEARSQKNREIARAAQSLAPRVALSN